MPHSGNDDKCIIHNDDMLKTNDDKRIKMLLARFMDGETTLDEERELSTWFKAHPHGGDGLDDYRAMFGCFDSGMPLTEPAAHGKPDGRPRRRALLLTMATAAAVAAALVILAVPWPSADGSRDKLTRGLVCQGVSAVASTDSLPSGTGSHDSGCGTGPSAAVPEQPVDKAVHRRMTRRKSMHVPPSPAHLFAVATADSMMAAQTMMADARIEAAAREQDAAVRDMLRQMEEELRSADSYMAGLMDGLSDYDDGTPGDGADATLPANAY